MDPSTNSTTESAAADCIWKEQTLTDCIEKMAEEAVRQLDKLRRPAPSVRLKNLARRALGRGVSGDDMIFWPAGLLLLGLVEAGHTQEASAYLREWAAAGMPVKNPDDALTGVVLERLYRETGEACWQDGVQKIHAYLDSCRRDAEGSIVYGQRSSNSWIYADGAGQVSMFYVEEGQEELAERELAGYALHGIDDASGLPYHGYDVQSGLCYGIIGWGRAVGWLLLGIGALQEHRRESAPWASPDPEWEKLIREVLRRRRSDGLFSWQLDCRKGPLDTSASGMIYYGLLRGGWLSKTHETKEERAGSSAAEDAGSKAAEEVLRTAASSLLSCVDENGCVQQSSAECIDFAQYRQQYGCNAWGQGAVLAFLAAYQKEMNA